MIYVDASVILARLLDEKRSPADAFWDERLVSSRLLQYEVFVRLHRRNGGRRLAENAGALLTRVALLELAPPVLERAMEPFPAPVRTLDALHLASLLFLGEQIGSLRLASYDKRMIRAATALRIGLHDLTL